MGFTGDIWPVHPIKNQVHGLPCFADLKSLPAAPDACFLGVNRDLTIQLVEELRLMGAGGATCFASGFSEAESEDAEGVKKQKALLEAARDMPIIGPNCYGLINYLDGALLWPDQHGGIRVDTGVAILTQSSNIAINVTMQQRGLPIAYVVTAGNQAQQSIASIASTLIKDSRVTAIGLHIEGIDDPGSYEALGTLSKTLGKPVVALKIGATDQAQAAMVSHTKSLSGSDSAASAFLNRCGIARCPSLSVLIESLKLFHVAGIPTGNKVLSMSCSGGEAALASDTGDRYGIYFPQLSDEQTRKLRDALGPMVALANPLDYHTYIWNDGKSMEAMFRAMLVGDADMGMLVIDFPRPDRCTFESWHVALNALISAKEQWAGVLAIVVTLSENIPESIIESLHDSGVVALQGFDDALQAMSVGGQLNQLHRVRHDPIWLGNTGFEPPTISLISEHDAKTQLQKYGISVPKQLVLPDSSIAKELSEASLGHELNSLSFPLVLKGLGYAHKTENNAIVLNIADLNSLQTEIQNMHPPNGYLIEEQISGIKHELLVGITKDPVLGFQLTIGAGGTLTEILADSKQWLLPVSFETIREDLSTLRIAPLLDGYRGADGINWDAFRSFIASLHHYVESIQESLEEIEINPLICTEEHCIAGDALLRVGTQPGN